MNARLDTDPAGGRAVLRFERRLAHPVEKVWRALSDPAHLVRWFPSAVEFEPGVDAKVRFTAPGGGDLIGEGVIIEFDPPRVLAFTWNTDALRWELSPNGAGTLLVFTHVVLDGPMAGCFAAGWHGCLDGLSALLAGRPIPEQAGPRKYAERHDAYAASFGLGEATVTDDAEGWTMSVDRLLPHPPDAVWAALTATGEQAAGQAPSGAMVPAPLRAGPVTELAERTTMEREWVTGGTTLEYPWLSEDGVAEGRVRWELTRGHPGGTRVVVTQTGPARLPGPRADAPAAWRAHLDALAGRLRELAR